MVIDKDREIRELKSRLTAANAKLLAWRKFARAADSKDVKKSREAEWMLRFVGREVYPF
jgi:hypothetical protein